MGREDEAGDAKMDRWY